MASKTTEHRQILTAEDRTKAAFQSVKNNISGVERQADQLRRAFLALGGTVLVGSLLRVAQSAINTADEMGKMAQRTGVAVESLSALKFAAELNDVPLESLNIGLRQVSINMLTAARGSKEQAEAFKLLGVQVQDSAGRLRSTDTVLLEIADRFSTMADGTTKAALAQRVFGESGVRLIPLLNQGAAGIKELTDEAERLGLVISGETAQAAEQFNDNMRRLKGASEGVALTFGAELLPELVRVSEAMRIASGAGGSLNSVAAALGGTLKIAALGLGTISATLQAIGRDAGALFAATSLGLQGEFNAAGEALRQRGLDQVAELEALIKLRDTLFGDLPVAALDTPDIPDNPVIPGTSGGDIKSKIEKEFGNITDVLIANQNEFVRAEKAAYEAATQAAMDGVDEVVNAQIEGNKRLAESQIQSALAGQFYLDNIRFETDLLGLNTRARQHLIDMRFLEATGIQAGTHEWFVYAEAITRARDVQEELSRSWEFGATRALQNYGEQAMAVADQTERVFERAFKGMEDALVEFARTGEISFSDLVDSIIADLIRMQVQQNITGPLAAGLGSIFSGMFTNTTTQPVGFANGGSFLVGGAGGTDSQYVGFMATPGERVTVQTPGQQRAGGGDTYYIDARGADAAAVARLERTVIALNGSVEQRALSAVANAKSRGGSFSSLMRA